MRMYFELFVGQRRLRILDLPIRAMHNHSLGKEPPKLFDDVRAAPAQAHLELHVARGSAGRGSRKQKARSKREAQVADVKLRYRRPGTVAPGTKPRCG